jgi:O-antigen ligase
MKIESSLSSRSLLLIQGCLLSFISLLFIKSAVSSLVFVGIVAFGFLLILIYHFPNLVLPIFLTSLFWGEIYFRKGDFGVTISDPFFVLLTAGYLCVCLKQKSAMFQIAKSDRIIVFSFIVLVLIMILSVVVNSSVLPDLYIFNGAVKIAYMIQYLLAFLMVRSLRLPDKGISTLRLIFLLSLLQLPIAVYQLYFLGGTELNRVVVGSMSYHHGMLGTFMLIPFSLSIGQARMAEKKVYRIGNIVLAAIFLLLVILSGTRSALLGLFVTVAIFMALNLKWKRSNLKYVTFSLIGIITVYYLTPVKILVQTTYDKGNNIVDASSLGRLLIWQGAWDFFINSDLLHKLFGSGFGCFFLIPQKHVIFDGLRHSWGAHNNYLNALCETGLVGLIAFVSFFVSSLIVLYKRKHPLSKSFFYATIAMLFSGLTQETFWVTAAFHNLWLIYMVIFALVLKMSCVQESK